VRVNRHAYLVVGERDRLGWGLTGFWGGFEENRQRRYWVVSPFGLHSGLRQSGDAFGVAFFRGTEAPRLIPRARTDNGQRTTSTSTAAARARAMACRPGPLRVGRSLRDLCIPLWGGVPLVARKNFRADHREDWAKSVYTPRRGKWVATIFVWRQRDRSEINVAIFYSR